MRYLTVLLSLVLVPELAAQDLVDVTAKEIADLPTEVSRPILGVVDNQVVALGGWERVATADGDTLVWTNAAFVLDEDENSWEPLPAVDESARADAATVISGNALLIAGGHDQGAWSTSAVVLRKSDGRIIREDLPNLPTALVAPAGLAEGQVVTVAGFRSEASGEVQLYSLDLGASDPGWKAMAPVTLGGSGRLLMAAQNEGLFVMSVPTDGRDSELHGYTDEDGWVRRSGFSGAFDPIVAVTMGQAHIGVLSGGIDAGGDSGQQVLAYSTITDEWSVVGHWADPSVGFDAVADGSAIVVARAAVSEGPGSVTRLSFDVGKRPFFWLDYFMVGAYLTAMILIGFYFSRREKGTEDFFVGGRKMPWWAVGFSLYATGTSAISFMAIPAKSYATDWLYLAQNAIGTIAIIPVALIIVPLIRRLSITSTYEFLEMRFHLAIRLMGSVLAIVYQLGARMSVVLFLPALALSAVTGVGVVTSILFMGLIATLYTVLGGIKAVIWTDVVQVVVLLGGALLCLVIIILGVDGGVGGLLSVAAADSKMHMFDWRLDLTIPTVWLFLILATTDTITWPRDQVMVQRVLSTKSAKEAGFSVWTLALIVIPGSVLFFSLGTALYGFYKINPEKLSPLLNLDATFPFFIAAELPAGLAGLIIAALFAASMSTLDSSMNSVSTIIVVDFYKRFKKKVSDKTALRIAKWITVATGIFGTAFALVLSRYSLPSLWDTFIMLTGLLGGGFGGVYALGMFTRRANWQGALVGIVSSIFITLAVREYTDIHVLLYAGVAIISCITIGYLVSLFFPIQEGHLEGLTVYARDNPNGRA
ncbi:MAG: sodium/solute symporter [Rhodothermales bacterium]|nr:sodium/solute symporter [Rhodothermales bacterium]